MLKVIDKTKGKKVYPKPIKVEDLKDGELFFFVEDPDVIFIRFSSHEDYVINLKNGTGEYLSDHEGEIVIIVESELHIVKKIEKMDDVI
jgi:hypothetical protein